ncbi:MAG: hypothetical protein K9L79_09325 [Methylobacter tundripaludum]|nr:hypothetical protein [Methylobacter tundripaludum]
MHDDAIARVLPFILAINILAKHLNWAWAWKTQAHGYGPFGTLNCGF